MASKAKQDITGETALSAVEEALSVDFTDGADDINAIEAKIEDAASEIKKTVNDEKPSNDVSNTPPESLTSLSDIEANPPASPPAAANDEINPELATLIYSIQQKPSSNAFLVTFIISLVWLGACAFYGYQNILPTLGENFELASFFKSSQHLIYTAVTFLPLLPLWAFAILVRRSQEMRHAANSMTEAAIQLLQPENTASNSVATVGRAIRREVSAMGDGVERAIARAGELEFMVQKEVMNLERSYGDSELKLRRLVDEIGTERETMLHHADKLKSAISNTHSNLTSDIEVVSSKIEDTLRNATMSISDTLELRSDTITTKLSETSEGLINLLANTGDTLNAKVSAAKEDLEVNISQTTQTMANTITTNGKAIARLLETRTAGLQQATSIIDEKLEANKKEFDESFSQKTEEFTKLMQAAGNSVNSLLKSTTSEIAEQSNTTIQKIEEGRTEFRKDMSEKTVEFADMINSGSTTVKDIISTTASEVSEKNLAIIKQFEEQNSSTLQKIEEGRTEFNTNMAHQTAQFADMINSGSHSVKEIISASAADVAEQNLSVVKEFEEKRIALNQDMAAQGNYIAQSLSKVGDGIIAKLEGSADDFQQKGDQITQQIGDNLSIRTNEFASQMSEAGETIHASIDGKLSAIDESLTTSGNNLVAALGMRTEALGKVLQERTEAIGQTIGEKLSGFGQVLTEQVDGTVSKLQSQADHLQENTKAIEEVITNKTRQVEEAVKSSTINFTTATEANMKVASEKSNEINAALKETSDSFTNSINATAEQLNTTFTANKSQFSEELKAQATELSDVINAQTEGFSKAIDGTAETFGKTIEERTNSLSAKLSQGTHQLATALDEKSIVAAERMEASVKELDTRLSKNSNTIENQFAAGNQILEENLAKGKDELLGAISETLSQVGSEIDGKAEKISDLLTDRANNINNKLGSTLVETQRNLEAKTDELNELLSSRTSELSGLIENEAKPIISSIVEAGNETGHKLAGLSKMIGEEANTLFSNIDTSSDLLKNLIQGATGNLDLMQGSITAQIENFSNAVEITKQNVSQSEILSSDLNERMQNASSAMLTGIGGIAQRFEAQSIVLQDATRMIDAAQSNLEATLESKQDALQHLAVGLVNHSDQINTNMSSFNTMVTAMVEDASSKSKHVGNEISGEISKAIEDATSRFDDAVNAMRSAASTMRTELEDTRAQMRKGILELPDETEKNASAMRRVVTDQIAALRDLSAIVEKSGKVLDASPARTANVAQPAPQQRQYAEQQSTHATAARAPAKASPSVDMALRGSRPAFTPTANPTTTEPSKSSGWVSDLLRRASEEERTPTVNVSDNRSPNQVVDSLNSLSVDIANAIDHETSVELWDRYQRGETNVFTRRLYTLQGQQTFDEIRNKYSRDSEFRTAVDRYINDFQQLLGKETSNGQNQALTQSYLTSDTGKVYTMLAHASGRLGNQV